MTTEANEASGKEFREKFEATLAEKEAFREVALQAVLAQHTHVKAEDLKEVGAAQIFEKAKELEDLRTQEREALLREVLQEKGLDLEQLTGTPSGESGAASRIASLGSVSGTPVRTADAAETAEPGRSRIRAAL